MAFRSTASVDLSSGEHLPRSNGTSAQMHLGRWDFVEAFRSTVADKVAIATTLFSRSSTSTLLWLFTSCVTLCIADVPPNYQ